MTDRQPYSYTVLRYRHDALAGELINVGVVVFAPKSGFLGGMFRHTYGRISKLYPDVDGNALTSTLRRVETQLRRLRDDASGLFSADKNAVDYAKLAVDDPGGAFIWSDVRSGISRSPKIEVEKLFSRFVSKFDQATTSGKTDADVWRPVRDLLAERDVASFLEKKTISSNHNDVEFDHAWKNGIWHCFQPLSFDLKDRDSIKNKAAKWVGHIVGLSEGAEDFQTYFIVGEPSDTRLAPEFERAVSFLGDTPSKRRPKIVRTTDVEKFVESISADVTSHNARQRGIVA